MSIYNIPFSIQRRKKITVKFPKYAAMGYGTKKQVRNSRGKRAIGVRATEVCLWMFSRFKLF